MWLDRQCDKWSRYQQGIGPQKMLELAVFEEMQARNREWMERMERQSARREARASMITLVLTLIIIAIGLLNLLAVIFRG